MDKFSLIKELKNDKQPPESKLPSGIQYQQYEVEVDNKLLIVNIPLREAERFEQLMSENETISGRVFKSVLREVRGIRD